MFPSANVERFQFSQSLSADFLFQPGCFSSVIIVDDDDFPVARQMNIDFNGIGALLPGEVCGGERIFRRIKGSAAMGNDFHNAKLTNGAFASNRPVYGVPLTNSLHYKPAPTASITPAWGQA